ncbi:MAG: hypothetical protein M1838_006039 [Thelocarpon superellum]|nr:MAG: hypothetical protein M1838_006039 [Thelocarpon superellum]
MWIGQLLAMFSMAVLLCRRSGDALPEPLQQAEQAAETFRRRTVQCLILADYTSLVPHTLEAMLIYLHGEYAQSNDAQPGIFVTMGMVIRLALRMGYHRDPCHSPHISPFQAEMRRRMWTLVCHTDMMFASQNGLPSLVRAEQSDTRLPRNLLDDDMHEDMSELPPARPLTDPTPVAFVIVKDGIMRVYRRIVEHLATIAPSPYDNVLALDQQLQEARHAIPPYLRMRSMDQSIADPPELIIKRLYLEFGFQNARCALHRRYLSESQSRHRYAYSRSVCIEAAMRLLQHQAMLHAELQPGGQLSRESGYITSFTSHFFLTAAMIVCLELSNIGEEDGGTQREHLLDVLKRSHQIWCAESAQSHEARKVADALAVVLRNAHESNRQPWRPPIASPSSIPLFRSMALNTPTSPMAGRGCQTHSNDGVATGDVSNDQDCVGNADVNTGMTWEDMLQMPGGINWDAWDKQLDHLSFTAPAIATARS